jgi:hypothetical protein
MIHTLHIIYSKHLVCTHTSLYCAAGGGRGVQPYGIGAASHSCGAGFCVGSKPNRFLHTIRSCKHRSHTAGQRPSLARWN